MEEIQQIRINKFIAECGVCSRRAADSLINSGFVTIDERTAVSGDKVFGTEIIKIKGKQIKKEEEHVVLAYYKPVGVVCTEKDRHAQRIVTKEISYPGRLTYAGRLDKDSEGLLLMTNDGDLIDAMMRSRNNHEKEYIVKVNKEINEEDLKKLSNGIYLSELDVTTKPCNITKTGKYTANVILTQGVNRQIRRMFETVGYKVVSLKRIRVMTVNLAELKPGEFRVLGQKELDSLYTLCNLKQL